MKLLVASVLLTTLSLTAPASADWPQWRGPTRDGLLPSSAPFPERLQGDALQRRWRVELGPSYSGPIVTADRVFTTETKDKKFEVAMALDRATGRELWRQQWEGALSVPFFAKANGDWIRATPAWDGAVLYVAGMRDVLVALDGSTGAVKWRCDFVEQFKTPVPAFGFVSSPLVDGEALYVQAGASLLRLKKATGEVVWRALEDEGGMWGSVFSSPIIATLAGQRQLLVQTRTTLAGVDLESGRVLWRQAVEAFRGMNILTPVVFNDHVFTSTYGGKTIAFRVTRENDQWRVAPAWTLKQQGYMSTPVVIGGHAYHHLRSQRMTCLDLTEGVERWTSTQSFGKYMSLVARGDRILALDQRGILYLIRANPEQLEVLDERKLDSADSWAHLAVSGQELFVRELNALAAYAWGGREAKALTVVAP
ncbi:MAG: PQQ-binding-like beta-propeller repeat protein [Verrucomicrobia bacterium]|nr:PQQ-binding-like beta-propeller repeat protein [Verrucomicrobiota bacterium]